MIEIIKPGEIKKYTMICPSCGCEFTYDKSDLESEYVDKLNTDINLSYVYSYVYYSYYVKCPYCGEKLFHSYGCPDASPKPIEVYYSDSTSTQTQLDCDKCPNKPDPNKPIIGDTPCTWCKKNQITCTNHH